MTPRFAGDTGIAGLWVVWAVLLVAAATVTALLWAGAVAARHQVAAAADLSALAAGRALATGAADPCAAARAVAERMAARLVRCRTGPGSGLTVDVLVVASPGTLSQLGAGPVRARARAGVPP